MPVNSNERPLDFRERDVRWVMDALRLGRSCVVIGVDGVGKTSLLRHCLSRRIGEHYLGEEYANFTLLAVDAHELAEPSALAYYRSMAFILENQLSLCGQPVPEKNVLAQTNEAVVRQELFERIEAITQWNEQQRIVFFFDEFNLAFSEAELSFFRGLQAIRNRGDGRVYYVIASSNEPALLCDQDRQRSVHEMYAALFDGNVWGLKPFGTSDAYAMLERGYASCVHPAFTVRSSMSRRILEVTGAHPGILKSVLASLVEGKVKLFEHESVEQITKKLLADASVYSKCEQLWHSLSETEQRCFQSLHAGIVARSVLLRQYTKYPIKDAIDALLLKGLWQECENQFYRSFAPLVTAYVVQRVTPAVQGLQLDAALRSVYIDGRALSRRLSKQEFRLLELLASQPGRVFPREETTRAIYREDYTPQRDDGRLDALVERVRKHIGDPQRLPRFLETVRGIGHRLNDYGGPRS